MLRCSNIAMHYGDSRVLHDASVFVEPGKMTAIIGPSGAGKSTILRILACLEPPESGTVEIDGEEFRYPAAIEAAEPQPWPRITAVFQQLFLWPHMTLRENISLPLRLRSVPDMESRVGALIERFDMGEFIDRYPNEVSGGQRQRAAIARALALKPAYLLLDEITSALDVEQAAAIIKHLDFLKAENIGILMITHYLGFLQRSADQIIFMENGMVAEQGGREILLEPKSPGMQRFLASFNEIENTTPLLEEELRLMAEGIYARFRKSPREFPDEDHSDEYNQRPIIDHLRKLTTPADLEWIKAGISEERVKLSGLLISLLESFDKTPEIHGFLIQAWKTASPTLRAQLLWRILDMPSLPEAFKQELFDFVLREWEIFNRAAAKFLAKNASVIDQVRERLADPRWPHKKWLYLCRVVQPEPDRTAVQQLLRQHLGDPDDFTQKVAQTLLQKFFPESRTTNQKENV
jgi:ABC-type methionine transport system ATPase subunit